MKSARGETDASLVSKKQNEKRAISGAGTDTLCEVETRLPHIIFYEVMYHATGRGWVAEKKRN